MSIKIYSVNFFFMYNVLFKRGLDVMLALIFFFCLLPIFLVIVVTLFCKDGKNPFFLQKRPGKQGKIFSIIKFKTMNDERDLSGILLSDEHRMTKIGKFIRKYSLDEIPQL